MTTQKYTPASQLRGHRDRSERGSCPRHIPILAEAFGEGHYVARCLACGLNGPEGEAKLAFDEFVVQGL
jgi:hypothetical protein